MSDSSMRSPGANAMGIAVGRYSRYWDHLAAGHLTDGLEPLPVGTNVKHKDSCLVGRLVFDASA